MKTIVLDSYALLAYFENEAGWKDVAQLLTDAAADRCALQCCVMDDLPIELMDVDRALTREAARLKVDGGLAYVNCFAAGLALISDGEVVTGDPEFEAVDNRVAVRWLPSDQHTC